MGRVPNRGRVNNSWKKFGDLYDGFLWFSSSNRSQIGRAENASAISVIWNFLNMAFPLSTNYLESMRKGCCQIRDMFIGRSLVTRQCGVRIIRAARSIKQAIPGCCQPKIAPCAKGDIPASPWKERTLPRRQGYGMQRAAESQGPRKRLQRLGFSPVAPSEGFLSAYPQAGALRGDRSVIRHEQGMYGRGNLF